jgi:predicted 2-oxoglutarate/Fe(II)-dependent dioxygenase YbiX|tara:strand:+ start:452 stop:1018 length:567 start_codon:yes stop_codon:yes gene_type:complete
MLLDSKVKIKKNVLSKEECAKLIADSKNFEYDMLKRDTADQSIESNKETLDKNTVVESEEVTFEKRKVSQSPMEPVFAEWDGNPVYRCKIMKYEQGEFVNEHKDAQWMCMSNYWAPDTNMSSESLMVMPLNDDYEGGEFTVEGTEIPQEVGSVIQIPCDALDKDKSASHGVKEVLSGTRYSLVFWNFK